MSSKIQSKKEITDTQQFREVSPQKASDDVTSIQSIPDELLLEIIAYLPKVTQNMKEAIDSLNALSKTNKKFHTLCQKKYAHALLYNSLLEKYTSQDVRREARKNGLDISPSALEVGSRIHIRKHLYHKLDKIVGVDQQLTKLTDALVHQANALFGEKQLTEYTTVNYDKRELMGVSNSTLDDLFIRVRCNEVEILSPFQSIQIKKVQPKTSRQSTLISVHHPGLAIAENLIHRLGATLVQVRTNPKNADQSLELSNSDSPRQKIRKIEDKDLKQVSDEQVKSRMGTQKLIMPYVSKDWSSWYKIGKVGNTVLQSSEESKAYSHSTLNRVCILFKKDLGHSR